MVHGVIAARPQVPSLDSESRGWGDSLAEPVHPALRGNRSWCRATTLWLAGRSRRSLLLRYHAMLHCALNVYGIMQCCTVLSVFRVRVVRVVCDCVLSHTLWHTGITVNSCYDGTYALLHCTLSV